MGWGEQHGPDVEAQLRMEVEELRPAFDTVWHRLADVKRRMQHLLTAYQTRPESKASGKILAEGLELLLSEHMQRPRVVSPHELRLKHLRQHALMSGADDTDGAVL